MYNTFNNRIFFSSMVYSLFEKETFFGSESCDITRIVEKAKIIFEAQNTSSPAIKSKEVQLRNYLGLLKRLPLIYSEANIQKCILLYLMALNKDVDACSDSVKTELEDLIIGALESSPNASLLTIYFQFVRNRAGIQVASK